MFGLDVTSRSIVFCDVDDRAFNFEHTVQSNPTVFINSANASTTEWGSLAHDQTDFHVASGTGNIKLEPASNILFLEGSSMQIGSSSMSFNTAGMIRANYYGIAAKTDDGTHFGINDASGSGNHNLIFCSYDNISDDYGHTPLSTNPTLFVHSATAAASATDEWMSFAHDQTDGVVNVGTGNLNVTTNLDLSAGHAFSSTTATNSGTPRLSIIQTPSSGTLNSIVKFEAQGTSWNSGSRVIEIVTDDDDAMALVVNNGSADTATLYRYGRLDLGGNLIMTGGGTISTSAAGNLTLSADTTGYVELSDNVVHINQASFYFGSNAANYSAFWSDTSTDQLQLCFGSELGRQLVIGERTYLGDDYSYDN
jgi:hypothetical protein